MRYGEGAIAAATHVSADYNFQTVFKSDFQHHELMSPEVALHLGCHVARCFCETYKAGRHDWLRTER